MKPMRPQTTAKVVLTALTDLKKGDVRASLPQDWTGVPGKVADAFNDVVSENVRMSRELERLSRVVGKEGRLKERAFVPDATGFWRDSAESINSLIADLVHPTSEVARVIGAVAQGDLSKSMALEAEGKALEGEFLRTAMIINKMVEQLGTFSAEVTRVAREVGTEGKLGGQADVQGVAGTWKDLTDSVNSMGSNLTAQVRNIAEVTTAVAAGDLVQEDHGGREGRNPGTQEHHQHHGGPVAVVRLRSDAGGARSGYRRQAGRPGRRAGRGRHLEGPDRQRELHGR
jgi:hypothetical protein